MNPNQLNEELLLRLARKFKIDTDRFKPVRVESIPLFAIYCIDQELSKIESREWITKFVILPADLKRVTPALGISNFRFETDKKYANVIYDEAVTIDFPEIEDYH